MLTASRLVEVWPFFLSSHLFPLPSSSSRRRLVWEERNRSYEGPCRNCFKYSRSHLHHAPRNCEGGHTSHPNKWIASIYRKGINDSLFLPFVRLLCSWTVLTGLKIICSLLWVWCTKKKDSRDSQSGKLSRSPPMSFKSLYIAYLPPVLRSPRTESHANIRCRTAHKWND